MVIVLVPFYFYTISTNIKGIAHRRLIMVNNEIKNTLDADLKFLATINDKADDTQLNEISNYFKNIIFIDENGNIFKTAKGSYLNGVSIANEEFFKKVKFYKKPVIKYVVQSVMNPYPAILIIVPKGKNYVIGIASHIISTKNNTTYYILADSSNNINATNFDYIGLNGNIDKFFDGKTSGRVFVNGSFYYFEKSKVLDDLYLYILEKITTQIIVTSIAFIIAIILSIIFMIRFLLKNIKMLSNTFDFIDTFSKIFTDSTKILKKDMTNLSNEMFLYDEKISKLETNVFEFKKMKNTFNEFFKFTLQQIEEITSRDEEIAAMNQDLELMYTEVESYSNQLSLIIDTISKIDTDLSVEEFLNKMHNGFTSIFDVETLIIFKVNGKIYKIGSIIELSDNITKIPLMINSRNEEEVIGNIFISGKRKSTVSEMRTYDMFAKILSIFITHKIKSQQIEELYFNAIKALASAVEIKDEYTRGHSERVAKVSLEFAKHLKVKNSDMNVLYQASILHDIGKIGIPDAVLSKPGKLTKEEYNIIKEHPFLGYKIVTEIKGMENIAIIIKHHHERWDGKGYPDGLKGENIPFLSRIISIADSYDAMYSNRSYRKALSLEVIKEIFSREKGKQWDPELVDKFLEIIDTIGNTSI